MPIEGRCRPPLEHRMLPRRDRWRASSEAASPPRSGTCRKRGRVLAPVESPPGREAVWPHQWQGRQPAPQGRLLGSEAARPHRRRASPDVRSCPRAGGKAASRRLPGREVVSPPGGQVVRPPRGSSCSSAHPLAWPPWEEEGSFLLRF
jgi:hypothetical protein